MPPTQPPPLPPPRGIRVAAATEDDRGLDAIISMRAGRAPFVTFVDINQGQVLAVQSLPNPMALARGGAGVGLAQWLAASRVSVFLAPRLGPNLSMVLQSLGIKFVPVPPGTRVRDALRMAGVLP